MLTKVLKKRTFIIIFVIVAVIVGGGICIIFGADNRLIVMPETGSPQAIVQEKSEADTTRDIATATSSIDTIKTFGTGPAGGIRKNVYVLNFNPVDTDGTTLTEYKMWADGEQLTNDVVKYFSHISFQKLELNIVTYNEVKSFPPIIGADFNTFADYDNCINDKCWEEAGYVGTDYLKVIEDYGICELFNDGKIDELWLWGGPGFGYWEAVSAGQGSFWMNGSPILGSSCNSILPIMGLNYERNLGKAIHSFGHRQEGSVIYEDGTWAHRMDIPWDAWSIHDWDIANYNGCGNIHYVPTTIHSGLGQEYIYDILGPKESYCEYFYNNYPDFSNLSANKTTVSCNDWDCTELGYYSWWFGHLPNKAGINSRGTLNDWWMYMWNPITVKNPELAEYDAITNPTLTPTPTSTPIITVTNTPVVTPTITPTPDPEVTSTPTITPTPVSGEGISCGPLDSYNIAGEPKGDSFIELKDFISFRQVYNKTCKDDDIDYGVCGGKNRRYDNGDHVVNLSDFIHFAKVYRKDGCVQDTGLASLPETGEAEENVDYIAILFVEVIISITILFGFFNYKKFKDE